MLSNMEKNELNTEKSDASQKGGRSKKQRDCLIYLLTGQQFRCQVAKKATGLALMQQVYDLLNISEADYFGLYFKDLSEHKYWLESNKSIKDQVKNGPWCFYFSVKFYPPDPAQLLEDITRYYMVLQLRDDIVGGRLPCSFVTHALLGSYVVQSELGDFDRGDMRGNYVSDFSFAPNQTRDLEEKIMELHKTLRGQTPEQAEKNYLENAKKLPFYGVDLHLSQDSDGILLHVGISWNGILIYRDGALINRFAWPRIVKLSYVRSKFYITIRPLDGDSELSMIGFKIPNHRAAKTVWKSSVEHHAFFRLTRSEPIRRPHLVRVGSKFRYSGRTQQETRTAVATNEKRVAPKVVRSDSRRLRSGTEGPSSVRATLPPVQEESSSEIPPELPLKTRKRAKDNATDGARRVELEVITTTETEEVEEVIVTKTAPQQQIPLDITEVDADRQSLTSSDEEESQQLDISKLVMTEHQKAVHKMKSTDEKNKEEVEFMESQTPRKAASQDSLDMIDARLSPRKVPDEAVEKIQTEELITSTETIEVITTETIVVATHEERTQKPSSQLEPSGSGERDPAILSSSTASTISSRDADELLKDELSENEETQSGSDSESDPIPVVTSPEDRSPSSASTDHSVEFLPATTNHIASMEESDTYVVTPPEDEDLHSDSPTLSNHVTDEPVQIATVETRTVKVEEVLIPQNINEVRQISLATNENDDVISSSAGEADISSASSLSSSSSSNSADEAPLYEPPTVKTAPLVVDSYVEEVPKSTTNPPMVHTELKTITYESTQSATIQNSQPQLISSQIISSETEHTVTTTEITKVVRGDVSETRVEKQMVTIGSPGVDHNKAMAEMIRDTQRNNPNINITKVVVHEERSVVEE